MKNVIKLFSVLFLVSSIFFGCKKDGDNLVKNHKMLVLDREVLREYENYIPDETTVNNKLLTFAGYINEPANFPMPNMEIKEAIWFLETFFNAGFCPNQKYVSENTHSEKTYLFEVSFEQSTANNQILLNGCELQTEYRTILETIASEICTEYAVNVGDIYIQSMDCNTMMITLGLDICYGTRKKRDEIGVCIEDPNYENCGPWTRQRLLPEHRQVLFPSYGFITQGYYLYLINNTCGGIRDTAMIMVLNQSRTSLTPTNIVNVDKSATAESQVVDFASSMWSSYATQYMITNGVTPPISRGDEIPPIPANGIWVGNYIDLGTRYRDYLYSKTLPDIRSSFGLGANYEPVLGWCTWNNIGLSNDAGDPNYQLIHRFSVGQMCIYRCIDQIPCGIPTIINW